MGTIRFPTESVLTTHIIDLKLVPFISLNMNSSFWFQYLVHTLSPCPPTKMGRVYLGRVFFSRAGCGKNFFATATKQIPKIEWDINYEVIAVHTFKASAALTVHKKNFPLRSLLQKIVLAVNFPPITITPLTWFRPLHSHHRFKCQPFKMK